MTALVDMLGARAILQLRHPQSPTSIARAKHRGLIKRQLLNCTRCELAKSCTRVAFSCSSLTPRFVVVTETPRDPSLRLLRALMEDVEIDPDDALYTSTVSCVTEKPPLSAVEFCRDNLFDSIECAYVPFVLLVGAGAFRAFRDDLNVTNHHGRMFIWLEQYAVMGITHPSAAIGRGKHFKEVIREDLRFWRDIVYGGDDPIAHLGIDCAAPKCGVRDVEHWDRDGVPWCKGHYTQYGKEWEKQRRRFDIKVEQLSAF